MQRRELIRELLCVPGHGRFVAAPTYDRIGEKGNKKEPDEVDQDNGQRDGSRNEFEKKVCEWDAHLVRVENPRRG